MEKINSLTGMLDLISSKYNKDNLANKIFSTEKALKKIFENFSRCEIRNPALENTSLFKRSVGDNSDIVNKELYSFLDKSDKSISLRPEGTASVIRSIIEKKLEGDPQKLWYLGPMWRYERPQKGRFRQFNQGGVEILGFKEGIAEFEIISLICEINRKLEIKKPKVKINHLGNNETKNKFCEALKNFLEPLKSKLDKNDLNRLQNNPLRILDSKNKDTQEILAKAPSIRDYLSDSSVNLLIKIQETFSDQCEIEIDHGLVRGLDYYSGFVFEAISEELGAQDAYIGGGRYDNLCSQLGGKNLPAIGMAIGIERLALISNQKSFYKTLISFLLVSSNFEPKAYKIAHDIRLLNNNVEIDVHLSNNSLKSKLRRAAKDKASYAVIIGDDEVKSNSVILKPLNIKDSEQTVMTINELKKFIQDLG